MRDYMLRMGEVAHSVYRLDGCQMCLLNVYGVGKVEGEMYMDDSSSD